MLLSQIDYFKIIKIQDFSKKSLMFWDIFFGFVLTGANTNPEFKIDYKNKDLKAVSEHHEYIQSFKTRM